MPSQTSFTVFVDIYAFNTSTAQYINCVSELVSPSYFGTGGYSQDHHSLVIYSGRTNSQGNQQANTYYPDIQIVDFSGFFAGGNIVNPTIRGIRLLTPMTGRQHASSVIINRLLYVFGGMTGPDGMSVAPEVFFAVNLDTGIVSRLSMTNSPFSVWVPTSRISPAMFVGPAVFVGPLSSDFIYFYSGLLPDYQTFANTANIFVYQISQDSWVRPTSASLPSNIFNLPMPNLAWACSLSAAGWLVNSFSTHLTRQTDSESVSNSHFDA